MAAQPNRRIWVQNVAVEEIRLRARLDALRARRLGFADPEAEAVEAGVRSLLERAANAAYRVDPQPRRLSNWWSGTLVEAGYQNLHAARAEIVQLYDEQELRAELPDALARIEEGLQQDDPRRAEAQRMATATGPLDAASVRKLIETGYSAADQTHSRVRSFRNVVLVAASVLTVFLIAFAAYVSTHPSAVPLCFTSTEVAGANATTGAPPAGSATATTRIICPTSETVVTPDGEAGGGPAGRDVLVVALLGILGAGLASAISLRNVRGTSTPYDVPTSLAFLKVPTGALTAIAALVAIRGDFVPGLSILDSQEQILAYALVFGYAQQLLTGLVDRQGQSILASVPSKDSAGSRPSTALPGGLPAGTAGSATEGDDDDVVVLEDPDPDAVEGGPVEVALDDPDDSTFDDSGSLQDVSDDDEPGGGAADDAVDAGAAADAADDADDEDPNELEAPTSSQVAGGSVSVRDPKPVVGTRAAPGSAP